MVEEQKLIEVEKSQVYVPLGKSITFETPKEVKSEPEVYKVEPAVVLKVDEPKP
jgi:hypothetical protein